MARVNTKDWYVERLETVPTDLEQWTAEYHATKYIYFKRHGKNIDGVCSHCMKKVKLEKARSGAMTICPKCGTVAKAINIEKSETKFSQSFYVQFLSKLKHDNRYVIQYFEVEVETDYMKKIKTKSIPLAFEVQQDWCRTTRYVNVNYHWNWKFQTNKAVSFKHGTFSLSMGSSLEGANCIKYLYSNNLQELFQNTKLKYCQLWTQAEKQTVNNVWGALSVGENTPQLEYCIKLGLYELAKGIVSGGGYFLNRKENNVIKFLGLEDVAELEYIRDTKKNVESLRMYRKAKEICKSKDNGAIEFYSKLVEFNEIELRNIFAYMKPIVFYNYYKEQLKTTKVTPKNFTVDYRDHILNCNELGYDMQDTKVFKPREFYRMHDYVTEIVVSKKMKIDKKQFKKVHDVLKMYEYSNEKYTLLAPVAIGELEKESRVLNHCVRSYGNRLAELSTYIFFIRKNEALKMPFYTLELNPTQLNIVQCRGRSNTSMPTEIRQFVTEWQNKIVKKMKEKTAQGVNE